MKNAIKIFIALAFVGFALPSALMALSLILVDRRVSNYVKSDICDNLPIGSSANDIEKVFKSHNIKGSWDFEKYSAIIRDVGPNHSVSIEVYVDSSRKLLRCEVFNSMTGF